MKKIMLLVVGAVTIMALSGCVNDALLRASSSYYESTSPYLKDLMDLLEEVYGVSEGEKDSIQTNMEEFKKMLEKYKSQKAWYEF